METVRSNPVRSRSKYLSAALFKKQQQAQFRRRGVTAKRGIFLTTVDPETPRANIPQIRTPHEIKDLRKKLGMSGSQFGMALGVHPDTVRKYEATGPKCNRFPSMMCFRLMEFVERNPKLVESFEEGVLPHFTGPIVEEIRRTLCISQNVMANLLGTNRSTYITWERGRKPPSPTAARLLQIAAAHPDEIIPNFYE